MFKSINPISFIRSIRLKRQKKETLRSIEDFLEFDAKPIEEKQELWRKAVEKEKNKAKWKNLDASSKVQIVANLLGTIIMAAIAVAAISYSVKTSNKTNKLNQTQFEKSYIRDSIIGAMELEIAQKEHDYIVEQKLIRDEINISRLNNFMMTYFSEHYLLYYNSFRDWSNNQAVVWFENVDNLMEQEIDNPLLYEDKEIHQLWKDAMSSNKLAITSLKAGSKKGKDAAGLRQGYFETTHSRLYKIYEISNKKHGLQLFFKITGEQK